jgi:hypothetical protein
LRFVALSVGAFTPQKATVWQRVQLHFLAYLG